MDTHEGRRTWDSSLHASLDTVSPSNLDGEKLIITRLPSSLNRLTNHVAISLVLFDSHSYTFFFFFFFKLYPQCMWDLSSLARHSTPAPCVGRTVS